VPPGSTLATTSEPTFTHGTDARWLRATEHNDEFDENRLNLTLFQLEPLVQEDADRGNKRKAPAGADADVDVADDGAERLGEAFPAAAVARRVRTRKRRTWLARCARLSTVVSPV